jgi:Na+/H+ antiporter NhaD/arsenite permease-like protein
MSGLDIFAWIVFIVILLCVAVVFVSLAQLPGKTARERNHPQAEAINVASWLGLLLTMGVVWVIAMIWSRTVPLGDVGSDCGELERLRARVAELENQLAMGGEA